MEEVLSIKNLNKTFESGFKLKDVNFDIKEGEVVSLIGESGSGKTSIGASLRALETWSLMGFLPGRTSYLPGYRIARLWRWFRAALEA